MPEIKEGSTDAEVTAYALQAMMPVEWIKDRLRHGKSCPRSLCGIPIEVRGKPRGVLVLDSRKPDSINYQSTAWPAFMRIVPVVLEEFLKQA